MNKKDLDRLIKDIYSNKAYISNYIDNDIFITVCFRDGVNKEFKFIKVLK